ncbi:MAG: hypothetical protein HOD55_00790 [Candidatus Thioglobus sp.]|nr:hypothetical protein [Candidatus Thioglobus sp.]MBT6655349.1 hypothetical protein [Candidatus Thioglobus sp.]MBT7002044.1 hypothetical protein [Candidatus Thioglobus sp.]
MIRLYGDVVKELRDRSIIRTKNVVGDLGERMAVDYYVNTSGLPNLQDAPTGTQNIDAISRDGNRYSIKSLTGSTTGVFYGLPPKDSDDPVQQKFEYLIIVKFDDNYELERIIELTWIQFLNFKKWHSRMQAWNITLNKKILGEANIVFEKSGINS